MDNNYSNIPSTNGIEHANTATVYRSADFKIVGDIGGTNARFACVANEGNYYNNTQVYQCSEFEHIQAAIQHYINYLNTLPQFKHKNLDSICLAIAGPVFADIVNLPNNHWEFSRTKLQRGLGVPVRLLNDFTAQAYCLDILAEDELQWFDDMRPTEQAARVLIGPGTGLGISIQTGKGEIIPSEAGHIAFAPRTPHQLDILQLLWTKHPRVSIERILSGQGLENLYWANSKITGSDKTVEASKIQSLAQSGDPVAQTTLNDFFQILACFSGDLAMTAWASGGVYLSGGILPKLSQSLELETFRKNFQDKGRFTDFCRRVPIALVTTEQPGLLGCVAALRT